MALLERQRVCKCFYLCCFPARPELIDHQGRSKASEEKQEQERQPELCQEPGTCRDGRTWPSPGPISNQMVCLALDSDCKKI